jgi:hypothetical protein
VDHLTLGLSRLLLALQGAARGPDRDDRDDRGDVPGWVLVTVMSVGIVLAIWGLAQGELTRMLRSALNSVQ